MVSLLCHLVEQWLYSQYKPASYPLTIDTPKYFDRNPISHEIDSVSIFILIVYSILSTLNLDYLFDYAA